MDVTLSDGTWARAAVPSGASTGKILLYLMKQTVNNHYFLVIIRCAYDSCVLGVYEALELRDGGKDYLGKGVTKVKI